MSLITLQKKASESEVLLTNNMFGPNYVEDIFYQELKRYVQISYQHDVRRLGVMLATRIRFPRGNMMAQSVRVNDDFLLRNEAPSPEGYMTRNYPQVVAHHYVQEMVYELMAGMETWIRIAKDELKFSDILQIRDIEQRMVALKRYGVEKILHDAQAKSIHKSERGNELFLIQFDGSRTDNVFSQDAYYLKYSCPSTGRIYISGVPPEMGITKDADACMAWKHGLSTEIYKLLNEEA